MGRDCQRILAYADKHCVSLAALGRRRYRQRVPHGPFLKGTVLGTRIAFQPPPRKDAAEDEEYVSEADSPAFQRLNCLNKGT